MTYSEGKKRKSFLRGWFSPFSGPTPPQY